MTKQMATIRAGERIAKEDSIQMFNLMRLQYQRLLLDMMQEFLVTMQEDSGSLLTNGRTIEIDNKELLNWDNMF